MKKEITQSEIKKIVNASDIETLKKYLKIESDQDVFKLLLEYIDKALTKFNLKYGPVIYKILGFLEELSVKEDTELMQKYSIITVEREKVISLIKETDKKDRQKSKKIALLKELANRLENLEVNIVYNLKSPLILANYNIVKYIVFELKDINLTKDLINKNSYLINAFNMKSEDLLKLVIDKYLKAISDSVKSNKTFDLYYYDEVLEQILKNEKITKNRDIIEKSLRKISSYESEFKGKDKQNELCWQKHLIKMLDNPNYADSIEDINDMYSVNIHYKKEVLEEAQRVGERNQKLIEIPLANDYIITIDGDETMDRDDALSVKKLENGLYQLKIFIADPNTFLGQDSLIIEDARNRKETLYLSDDTNISMFPPEIVEKYLSLDENKYRLVREYNYKISSTGVIEDFTIAKKKIRVNKNYTYDEANKLLKKCDSQKTEKLMENLLELRDILTRRYIDDSRISDYLVKTERLIETYMIFNGNKTAEFFSNKGIPFVYRHYKVNKDLGGCIDIETIPENNKKKYIDFITNMEKTNLSAVYSMDKKSHEALGFSHYCHCTSPIRRYPDVLVNECEDMFYFSRATDKQAYDFEEYLKEEIEHLNERTLGNTKYCEKYAEAKVRSLCKK